MTDQKIFSFPVNSNLRKPQKLPNNKQYHVHENEIALCGKVPCYMRYKSFLGIRKLSSLKYRKVVVTKDGVLIIYNKNDNGFVIDIQKALSVKTSTENVIRKSESYQRCHSKLKFSFGSIHIFVFNDNISTWKNILFDLHETGMYSRTDVATMTSTEDFSCTEPITNASAESENTNSGFLIVNEQQVEKPLDQTDALTPIRSSENSSTENTTSDITVINKIENPISSTTLSSNSGLLTTSDNSNMDTLKSIRTGYKTVNSLCRNLEDMFISKRNISTNNEEDKARQDSKSRSNMVQSKVLIRSKSVSDLSTINRSDTFCREMRVIFPQKWQLKKECYESGYDGWNISVRA